MNIPIKKMITSMFIASSASLKVIYLVRTKNRAAAVITCQILKVILLSFL